MAKSLYSTTEEHTKSARMGRAVVDLGGDICRSVLSKYVPPQELLGKLQVGRPVRFENMQRELIMDVSSTGYEAFDLTLLYKLLRNVAGIDPPKKGWGKPPRESDLSESDDIERIHNLRNDAYGHITCTRDPGKEWDKYWRELEGVCERMDKRFIDTTFLQDLEFIKTCPMDEQLEKTYTQKLKEMNEKEFDLSSRIHDLEGKYMQYIIYNLCTCVLRCLMET
ncbi:hypothetical protein FSP39_002501 [Pinctada imbricata]|uniref:DZIP3-like HEPN domain-containing protein n=1 Tax=Pinctada imbricata TaxID=66713 RepID=A0AA88YGK6_PINIB|nr:hypothetical protein FSP39_002501 [Pinctada imbricata]